MKRFALVITFLAALCIALTTVFAGLNHVAWADNHVTSHSEPAASLATPKTGTAKDLLGTDGKSSLSTGLKSSPPATPDSNTLEPLNLDRVSSDINTSMNKQQKSDTSNKPEIRIFKEGK